MDTYRRRFKGEWLIFNKDILGFKKGDEVQVLGNEINVYHYTFVGKKGMYSHGFVVNHTDILETEEYV